MASKFADFLTENKIDPRRVMSSSNQIERLRPEDRRLIIAKRNKKEDDSSGGEEGDEKAEPAKRRSGRPVTSRLLVQASAGDKISGPAKTRLLRAVNRILEQKKKDPVELRTLF